ncbi:MAG TPA: MarR family winged helix-turn-helix transcriptional regulator [Dongiaceae bacterium]|nr:MarR family winged helix-turn-helix transcriptional regulator [Dongiaceae bacterium]
MPGEILCFKIVSNETNVKEVFHLKRSTGFRLEDFLPYRLSVTTNRISRAFAAHYEQEFGISIPEWRVIAVLGAFAPLSSNAICERTAMDKAKVSRAVASLLKRGLIQRDAHATDQRLIQLTLSKTGRKIYEAIIPRARAIEAEVTKGLSKTDIAALHRILDRIGARLDVIESN